MAHCPHTKKIIAPCALALAFVLGCQIPSTTHAPLAFPLLFSILLPPPFFPFLPCFSFLPLRSWIPIFPLECLLECCKLSQWSLVHIALKYETVATVLILLWCT